VGSKTEESGFDSSEGQASKLHLVPTQSPTPQVVVTLFLGSKVRIWGAIPPVPNVFSWHGDYLNTGKILPYLCKQVYISAWHSDSVLHMLDAEDLICFSVWHINTKLASSVLMFVFKASWPVDKFKGHNE
jgi:hypothetical protein